MCSCHKVVKFPLCDFFFLPFFCELSGVQDADLSVFSQTMTQCCKEIKETVQMLASKHKDIHGSVSKVGKAIDRVSIKN